MPQPVAAPATTPAITWKAFTDRIVHGYHRAGARGSRSLCMDVAELPERFAVPAREALGYCTTCAEVAEQIRLDSMPEGEARALWGNR